jgi:two-component system response regulator HydG
MNVLLVDDDRSLCEWVEGALRKKGIAVTWRTSAAEGLALLDADDFAVVVADLNLRGMNGLELCERIVGSRPDTPVIVITAFGSLETAVQAIRAGAYDFIAKPFEIEELRLTLDRALSHRALRQELKRLRRAVDHEQRFGDLLGTSSAMRKVYDLIDRIAETDAAVLITGESGTGKELVARAIHGRSRRAPGPFVALNCSAMPETLLETELFGHVKGAFTDARQSRAGLFLQAQSGTLFLDEVGELPLLLQPKLLRALQERRVRPVGSDTEVAYDARLVAATNRDLELAVEEHRFREDLFYRINVLHVHLPPLRERGSDILLLAQHFVARCAEALGKPVTGLTPEAAERLMVYGWPGNVRELSNCVERAVALTRFDRIVIDDLPEKVRAYRPSRVLLGGEDPAEVLPIEEVERRYILWAVETIGNRTLAAQRLGLDRKTLYRKLARYDHPKKRDLESGNKG